jgi:hypothetical protein
VETSVEDQVPSTDVEPSAFPWEQKSKTKRMYKLNPDGSSTGEYEDEVV